MKRQLLTEWSTRRPRLTIVLTLAIAMLFGAWLPRMRTDTDPKNMLPATSDVRVLNDQVDQWFGLHADMIVVGIVRDTGIFERQTLEAVGRITGAIANLHGVVSADITSLTTADSVVVDEGTLRAEPLLPRVPQTSEEMERFRHSLMDNAMVTCLGGTVRTPSAQPRATVATRALATIRRCLIPTRRARQRPS